MKRKAICNDPDWIRRADCVNCAIRDRALFADLPSHELEDDLVAIEDLVFRSNSVIYSEGEEGHSLFTIRRGTVKLVRHLPDGESRIVRLLKVADVAGLEVVIGSNYKHTAIAVGETELCRIPVPVIERLNVHRPELSRQLMVRWQRNLDNADLALVEFSTGPAEARVARLLLHLCFLEGDGICPILGRQDMGALLGITTETASRVMAEFKRRGAVKETNSDEHCHCDVHLLTRIANPE